MRTSCPLVCAIALCLSFGAAGAPAPGGTVSTSAYGSIQEAIDGNPGKTILIDPGDSLIDQPLQIHTDGTSLLGYGRIVQSNPKAPIIRIENANGVRIIGITLTRSAGQEETLEPAIRADKCRMLEFESVQVIDNWSTAGAISLDQCQDSRIHGCSVSNYKRIGVDDRTENDLYGYAFKVIDGTGIAITHSGNVQVEGNRIVENRIYPTQEVKEKHHLGELTDGKKPTKKGRLAPEGSYANNWHQGSAIIVTSPEETDHVLITGNLIRNAAQGIDIHADHVTCSNNSIDHAFIGIKCMHGARNVIISGNNVSHMDLWGLVMLPGTVSHPAEPASADKPARVANYTHGNIIANNIFSDFGFGYEYFNWEKSKGGVISLESGQLPENPVMTDVIIQGNIVYDTGKDQVLVDGVPQTIPPRYEYAVFITPDPKPQGLVFANNVFHPGRSGVSNLPLEP